MTPAKPVVLVVDDEAMVVQMVRICLREAGVQALTADNGLAGLQCFTEHQAEIRLVLSDIKMPEMDGVEMVERILELNPTLPVLFMSAYSDAVLLASAQKRFRVLRKPFHPEKLIEAVELALGGLSGSAGG